MQAPDGKTLPELQSEHPPAPRGHRDPRTGEQQEQSAFRNYVRDLILGVNDGIVSVYALVAGLAGSGFSAHNVGLAGVAVGSSRVDLQACKLEYSIVSPK